MNADILTVELKGQRLEQFKEFGVVDGDTVKVRFFREDGITDRYGNVYETSSRRTRGDSIRVLGYDTPEKKNYFGGFFVDQPGGKEATLEAQRMIAKATKVYVHLKKHRDMNERFLGHIELKIRRKSVLLGEALIRKGLAYEAVLHYQSKSRNLNSRKTLFEKFEDRLLETWRKSPLLKGLQKAKKASLSGNYSAVKKALEKVKIMPPFLWRQINQFRVCTHKVSGKKYDCRGLLKKRDQVKKMRELLEMGRQYKHLSQQDKNKMKSLAKELAEQRLDKVYKKFLEKLEDIGISGLSSTKELKPKDFL